MSPGGENEPSGVVHQLPLLPIDACIVINLYATTRTVEILGAAGARVVVVDQVTAEALYVLRPGAGGLEQIAIDIEPEIQSGLMTKERLSEAELSTYVRYAAELDDGEAATLSLARHRCSQVATDDRAAQTFIQRNNLPLSVVRTSDLVRRWMVSSGPSEGEVIRVLREIRDYGRFTPNELDPHSSWWRGLLDRT